MLLGQIISVASGQPFEFVCSGRDPEPLRHAPHRIRASSRAEPATGYIKLPRPFGPVIARLLPPGIVGAQHGWHRAFQPFYVEGASYGGLVGDVIDASRLVSLHLGDGTFGGQRVMSASAARRMREIECAGTAVRSRPGLVSQRRTPDRGGQLRGAPRRRRRLLQRHAHLSGPRDRDRDHVEHHQPVPPSRGPRRSAATPPHAADRRDRLLLAVTSTCGISEGPGVERDPVLHRRVDAVAVLGGEEVEQQTAGHGEAEPGEGARRLGAARRSPQPSSAAGPSHDVDDAVEQLAGRGAAVQGLAVDLEEEPLVAATATGRRCGATMPASRPRTTATDRARASPIAASCRRSTSRTMATHSPSFEPKWWLSIRWLVPSSAASRRSDRSVRPWPTT